jgi:hypothetical protein
VELVALGVGEVDELRDRVGLTRELVDVDLRLSRRSVGVAPMLLAVGLTLLARRMKILTLVIRAWRVNEHRTLRSRHRDESPSAL